MTTIIATIKPFHLRNIRNGRKHWELRKSLPLTSFPFRVLCCESGSGGKILAEFIVDKYVWCVKDDTHQPYLSEQMFKECCVSEREFKDYAGDNNKIFAWHITNMIDYCSTKGRRVLNISEFGLKRPPQSWQYVKEDI